MKKSLLLIICFLLFEACKNEKPEIKSMPSTSLEKSYPTIGKAIPLSDVKRPISIKIIPKFNLLIVLESDESAFLGRAYSLDSFKLIRKFIKHSAEDGLVIATNINYKPDSKEITITDPIKKTLFIFSIDTILSNSVDVKPIRKVDLSLALEPQNETISLPVITNDNIINIRTNWKDSKSGILNFYDYKGSLLFRNSNFPELPSKFKKQELGQIYAGGLSISDDEKHLILEYYNTDILDLYDIKGNLLERVQGPDIHPPAFIKKEINNQPLLFPTKKSYFGYTGLAKMKDSTLFVLYSGEPQLSGNYHSSKLFKLNSRLEPLMNYSLNIPIFSFDVDWSTRKIYGLSHKPSPSIVIYSF